MFKSLQTRALILSLTLITLLTLPGQGLNPSAAQAETSTATVQKRPLRVLMIINEGFMAPEYYLPRQLFDQAGFSVTVAGKTTGPMAPDKRNTESGPVNVDISFDQVKLSDYDAITFAGGNGAWTDYFPSDAVHKLLIEALNQNMITGMICASTGLLGIAGNYNGTGTPIAKGRRVTGYYRVESLLRELGEVQYEAGDLKLPHVVIDGNLITGRDPMSSQAFGEAVVKALNARFAK